MLSFAMHGDVLEVKETLVSFNATRVSHWYYDTKRWLKSAYGRPGDVPILPMSQASIDWVKTRYLPRVRQEESI